MRRAFLVVALAVAGASVALAQEGGADERLVLLKGVTAIAAVPAAELAAAKVEPTGPFAVTASRTLLLLERRSIYDVAGERRLVERAPDDLSGVAVVASGLAVAWGKTLGYLRGGELVHAAALPTTGMKLAPATGGQALYVYGGAAAPNTAIYFVEKERWAKLVQLDAPVTALVASRGRVFFAAGSRILTYAPGDGTGLVYDLPTGGAIASLAYDDARRVVYFSSGDAVFALVGSRARCLVAGTSGELAVLGDGLLVADAKRRCVRLLAGIPDALAPAPPPAPVGFKR